MTYLKKLSLFGLIVSISSAAQAATLCVHPDGNGNCASSIQDAVDDAAAGDTIKIKPGTYYEAVNVPSDKTGLIIKGSKKSIIDSDDNTYALEIEADDVSVMNLAIHNSDSYGIYVNGADNVHIRGVHIRNADSSCIYIEGNSAVVEKNLLQACDSSGVYVSSGDDVVISKNRIVQMDSYGIYVSSSDNAVIEKNSIESTDDEGIYISSGSDAVVTRNKVSNIDEDGIYVGDNGATVTNNKIAHTNGDGIDVSGDDAVVTNNKITHANDNDGIDVSGSDAIVSRNKITHVGEDGINVNGDNFQITRNRVANFNEDGIETDCSTCDSALVEANLVKQGFGESSDHCFDIDGGGDGTVVNKNLAQVCGDDGFRVFGGGDVTLTSNRSMDAGANADGDGFDIDGLGQKTLVKNMARGSANNGFDLREGDGDAGVHVAKNELENNSAIDNSNDGFAIQFDTGETTLLNNKAIRNNRNGISLFSNANIVTGNKASNNREGFDFCDEGSSNTLTDNKFGSETTSCTP